MLQFRPRIYLASRSPRRRELLAQIGVPFDVLMFRDGQRADADTNEDTLPGEAPEAYVQRVAAAKAAAGLRRLGLRGLPAGPVLSADTAIALDGVPVGKPASKTEAADILGRLSGRSHHVLTAINLAWDGQLAGALSVTDVAFRSLSAAEIDRYVASGEPMDKAGAYGIQGFGGTFVREIRGSYTGVMGLPVFETAELLRRCGDWTGVRTTSEA